LGAQLADTGAVWVIDAPPSIYYDSGVGDVRGAVTYYNAANTQNQPLVLNCSNLNTSNLPQGDFTGGDFANTLKVTVYYIVEDL
jgi:hypothetical protein